MTWTPPEATPIWLRNPVLLFPLRHVVMTSYGIQLKGADLEIRWPSITGVVALMWLVGCGGVFTGIPDLDSPDGRVFAQRCGGCHGAPNRGGHGVPDPRLRTMSEWHEVLPKMDRLIRERGLPPLTESEREAIIRYLGHHAKT